MKIDVAPTGNTVYKIRDHEYFENVDDCGIIDFEIVDRRKSGLLSFIQIWKRADSSNAKARYHAKIPDAFVVIHLSDKEICELADVFNRMSSPEEGDKVARSFPIFKLDVIGKCRKTSEKEVAEELKRGKVK